MKKAMANKTVMLETTFKPVRREGYVKPESPLWFFRNTGNTEVFVSGMRILPGENFGLDALIFPAIALLSRDNIRVLQNTSYEIKFGTLLDTAEAAKNEVTLVETILKGM